jgi:GTP-binding protein
VPVAGVRRHREIRLKRCIKYGYTRKVNTPEVTMNPLYHRAQYLLSAPSLSDAPPDAGYEVAFAGRSNAGKSSALNVIAQQQRLARTSKTPGRTQMLNFFLIDAQRRFVDLPGYGYAKVPEAMQRNWRKAMESYLQERTSLKGVFLLMDVRHPLTEFDWQMIEWCRYCGRPIHIVVTKSDKLGRGAGKGVLLQVRQALRVKYPDLPVSLQLFSALTRQGIDEAHGVLDNWLAVPRGPDEPTR